MGDDQPLSPHRYKDWSGAMNKSELDSPKDTALPSTLSEALNEIEHLRAMNEILYTAIGGQNKANRVTSLYRAAQAEIGSLKGLLHHAVYCPRQACRLCSTIENYVNEVVDDF